MRPPARDKPGQRARSGQSNHATHARNPRRDVRAREEQRDNHAPALRIGPDTFAIHTQPGFESTAWSEIEARVKGAKHIAMRTVPDRAGMVIFAASHADALASIRTAEDVFSIAGYRRGFAPDKTALEKIANAVTRAPFIESALAARVKVTPGARSGRRLRFKVIARVSGEHEFLRRDFKRAVETGIEDRGDRAWRLDEAAAEVEFWATLLHDELILALRLSDDRMRIRGYKVEHRAGSLRPSVAAALAWLSNPEPGDVFLDPMCGTGTVLIERAHLGRYAQLLGGDSDRAMLEAARENIGPRYKPIELRLWDSTALPLPDALVNKIVTNLPWGIRLGTHESNRRLYPRLLAEFRRVIKPGGTLILLTGDTRLMSEVLDDAKIRPSRVLRVSVLGAPAAVYVCSTK